MSTFIESSVRDRILEITMSHQTHDSALTNEMYSALAEVLKNAQISDDVNVILLGGGEGIFTAGSDIRDFVQSPPVGCDAPVWQFFRALMDLQKPVIATVSGAAVGVGTTMLLHMDLIYATPNSYFALPRANLGLTPEGASSVLLPLLVGRARAAEILLCGTRLAASDAAALGLINAVVETSELRGTAYARAQSIAALPVDAVRETKRLLNDGMELLVARQFVAEQDALARSVTGPAARAALSRFLEKR